MTDRTVKRLLAMCCALAAALASPAAGQPIAVPKSVTAAPAPAPAAELDNETARTRSLIERFVQMLYVERRVREAFETFVREDYVQHNPRAKDGREEAIKLLSGLFERAPDRTLNVQRIIVDGNLAAVHHWSRASPDDRGHAVVDIFRVENDKIAEHWDVIQAVPEDAANDHPMF